ncbi:C4-dicarboxylate TRAP transporter large permease protein DctM [subsurface metagenome]
MVELSPTLVVIVMFGGLIISIFLGYPLFLSLAGVGLLVGLSVMGPAVLGLIHLRALSFLSNYILLAVPLFIFMGMMLEKSGASDKLYGGLHLWFGAFRGGLAIATVLMGTLLAACVGVIAASVTMMGLVAAPSMLKRGYNKGLVCGSICAGGTLGILIPPSIMLVIYGPMAQISVGKLFMAAFVPGFVLSALYIAYIAIRCWLKPSLAPVIADEERTAPLSKKLFALVVGILPPAFIVLVVLGSIFFGIATPTEAAGVGCLAATILALVFRQFNLETVKEVALRTLKITAMAMGIGMGACIFTGVFLRLGGGEAVINLLLSTPGGRWGVFAVIMFIVFILGMFIDWLGIVFVIIPVVTPITDALGFDPLWFAMMMCINLQMSFLTPPFAYAIFYLRGIAKPEWGISTADIMRGVIPFVILIMVGLGLCIAFPQLILWLPHQMIKF